VRERLYRSRTDRLLFGVAGGMADWLDVDPSAVRLVWVLLTIVGGAGLILYIVAAIIIPEEPFEMVPPGTPMAGEAAGATPTAGVDPTAEGVPGGAPGTTPGQAAAAPPTTAWMTQAQYRQARRAARRTQGNGNAPIILGLVLVLVGGWFLVRNYLPGLDERLFLPGLLIILGAVLIVGAVRRPGSGTPPG
jgi:phage shock protein C